MSIFGYPKAKAIKNVSVEIIFSADEKPTVGKSYPITLRLRPVEEMCFKFVFFELINERTDKRAPMDRVTSRSRYFYRYNVDKSISQNEENKHAFSLRIPVHKEPSRDDKFIRIRWQLTAKVILSKSETASDKPETDAELLMAEATPIEQFEVF